MPHRQCARCCTRMQFEENTDSNKRSVYSDPLLARISISRVQNRSPTLVPSFTSSHAPQIPYPILHPDFLSKEITAVVQCISSRCYTFTNNTTQIEIKTAKRERKRKKNSPASSANICALPDTEVFLRSLQESQDSQVSLINVFLKHLMRGPFNVTQKTFECIYFFNTSNIK